MLIGVLSDTHDRLTTLDRALEVFRQRGISTLIHAGDMVAPFAADRLRKWPGAVHVVYGNNDGDRQRLAEFLPQIQDGPLWVEAGGRRILVHHFIGWCDAADVKRADVIITGHTHEIVNQQRDGKLFLNPGECCGWITGRSTAAVLETDARTAEIIEVGP